MIVHEVVEENRVTSIVLKLVSKTFYAAMKKDDGTALVKLTMPEDADEQEEFFKKLD